jgi:hypothetical protein
VVLLADLADAAVRTAICVRHLFHWKIHHSASQ